MPLFLETSVAIPERLDTVRLSTVPRTARSNTELYDTEPGVFDAVRYRTPCIQDSILVSKK